MIIKSREQLSQLLQAHSQMHHRRDEPIVLEIAGLQSEKKLMWESDINRFYHDCGCSAGTVGLLIAVLVFVLLDLWRHAAFPGFGWRDIAALLVACILGAAGGKTIGLWRARVKLRDAVRQLIFEPKKDC